MKLKMIPMLTLALTVAFAACSQSKPASPPASVSQTTDDGITIKIDYSQPSVKGRTIGKDLEPKAGTVWRTGANKATTFEVNKDVEIEGEKLPAGKYSLFTLVDADGNWTLILNKVADQWGAFKYDESQDALRVKMDAERTENFTETMTFEIDKEGEVTLLWGNDKASFEVED